MKIGLIDVDSHNICLGNIAVPQQFYPVFQAIAEIEKGESQ